MAETVVPARTTAAERDTVPMNVRVLQLGGMQNFVYVLQDRDTRRSAVIDPAWDVPAILATAGPASITDILVTHWHEDHTNGVVELQEATGARVHALARETAYWGITLAGVAAHADGDSIDVGATAIRVVHTPGHSPGSMCLYADGKLFTGDTLFVYGCGRCDLPGGDAAAMYHSLQRLLAEFAPDTIVCPGHDYGIKPVSTLAEQRRSNPFLHQRSVDEFVTFRAEHNRHRQPPYRPVPHGEPAG